MMVLSTVAVMAQLDFFIVNVTRDGIGKSFATIAVGARLLPSRFGGPPGGVTCRCEGTVSFLLLHFTGFSVSPLGGALFMQNVWHFSALQVRPVIDSTGLNSPLIDLGTTGLLRGNSRLQ